MKSLAEKLQGFGFRAVNTKSSPCSNKTELESERGVTETKVGDSTGPHKCRR